MGVLWKVLRDGSCSLHRQICSDKGVFFWTHFRLCLRTTIHMCMRRATPSLYFDLWEGCGEHDQAAMKTAVRRSLRWFLLFHFCCFLRRELGKDWIMIVVYSSHQDIPTKNENGRGLRTRLRDDCYKDSCVCRCSCWLRSSQCSLGQTYPTQTLVIRSCYIRWSLNNQAMKIVLGDEFHEVKT